MRSFCRACFQQISDTSSSEPLDRCSYKHRLMFCIPEMDLRALPDANLCKDCVAALDVTYKFKIKCRKVEFEINKRPFDATERLTVKQETGLDNAIRTVCRICVKEVIDCSFHLTERPFYKSKLMLCFPEMHASDIELCNDCHDILEKIYVFKTKCLDVEKNIKAYLKSHDVVDLRDLSVWCNAFVKYEVGGPDDYTIKQEEIDLDNEVKEQVPGNIHSHKNEKSFKCSLCEQHFAQKSHLKEHIRIHTGEKPFECSLCEHRSARKSDMKIHIRIHTGEKPFKCPLCEHSSIQKSHLETHIRTHTGEKPFKCSLCEYSSLNKYNLNKHIRTHTGEKPFKCPLCRFSTAQSATLKSHILTHTGERPFKCDLCEFSAVQKVTLKSHIRTHTGEKPFKCSLCEHRSVQKSHLENHIRTHTGERPFKCSLCDRRFARKSYLEIHGRTHTGEKPFKCSLCEKSYTRKSVLKIHIRKHTSREEPFKR